MIRYVKSVLHIVVLLLPAVFVLPAQAGEYYTLDGTIIEFRLLSEEDNANSGYSWHTDRMGSKHLVCDSPFIDTSDVEAVMFRKTMAFTPGGLGQGREYDLYIFFRQDSWNKVKKETSVLVKKKIAVFVNGRLYSTPNIFEPFSTIGTISSIKEDDMTFILKGLRKAPRWLVDSLEGQNPWLKDL